MGGDSRRQAVWFSQTPPGADPIEWPGSEADWEQLYWEHHWHCQYNSYPDRTGDLGSITKITDFYSARQWHSTGMYCDIYRHDIYRPEGYEHELQLCLPDPARLTARPGRTVRLYFLRGPGPDFSERDRAVLTLLRPHLHQVYLDVERRRHPVPRLTPRQTELLHLVAAGHTNTQIARRLGISEATVRTHLENVYERLHVSSRTGAVTVRFPNGLPRAPLDKRKARSSGPASGHR
jgi:DNA-binding CsgD family transcriptional regulator